MAGDGALNELVGPIVDSACLVFMLNDELLEDVLDIFEGPGGLHTAIYDTRRNDCVNYGPLVHHVGAALPLVDLQHATRVDVLR